MYHPILTLETLDTLLLVSWVSLFALLGVAAIFPYIPSWILPNSETTSVFLSIAFISLTVIRLGCGYRKLKNILLCCGLYYFLISVALNGFFTRAVLGPIVWAVIPGALIPLERLYNFKTVKKRNIPIPSIKK